MLVFIILDLSFSFILLVFVLFYMFCCSEFYKQQRNRIINKTKKKRNNTKQFNYEFTETNTIAAYNFFDFIRIITYYYRGRNNYRLSLETCFRQSVGNLLRVKEPTTKY